MRLAQIELSLDPAPRLVLELAVAKQLVDLVSLGGDQLTFDLVVKLRELSVAVVAIASALDVLEPVAVAGAQRVHDVLGQIAFRPELVEPLHRGFDRQPPRLELLPPVGVALSATRMSKAERMDTPRHGQPLPHHPPQPHSKH